MEWLLNPWVAAGIGLAVLFFGYFFGLFEGRGQGYTKRKEEEVEDQDLQPKREPPPLANHLAPSDETPILGISMDTARKLQLTLDGQQVNTSAIDTDQRKRLIAILTMIRPWLEMPKVDPPPSAPRPAATPMPNPTPTSPPPAPAPAPQAVTPPLDADADEPATEPLSIVAQIDSVLQTRLAGTALVNKGIRLQESLEGGVIVWVGLDKYKGVDEVPDETVKEVIKAAIAEWENKYTPGD